MYFKNNLNKQASSSDSGKNGPNYYESPAKEERNLYVKVADDTLDENNQNDTFDFFRYFEIVMLHKWIFTVILLLCILASGVIFIRSPKNYIASFSVYYDQSVKEYVVESNVPVIKSDFDKNYWTNAMVSGQMMKIIRENSSLPYSLDMLKGMISAEVQDKKVDNIFRITLSLKRASDIPVLSKAYVEALNDMDQTNHIRSSGNLIDYFTKQIAESNTKLDDIDTQIRSLGSQFSVNKINDLGQVTSTQQNFQKSLMDAQVEYSSIKASRLRTEHELKDIDGTVVNETALSEPLKVQLMNLQVDLARALTKYTEDHPIVKGIKENIQQVSALIKNGIEQNIEVKSLSSNPIKAQLNAKLVDYRIQEISLETKVASLQKVVKELDLQLDPNDKNEGLQMLIRKRDMLLSTINLLNGKLIEAQSANQGKLSKFSMIDPPVIPTHPSNKKLSFFLLIGLVAGCALGFLMVYIYDLLDNRLRLLSDFEKFFKVPILGTVSHKRNSEFFSMPFDTATMTKEQQITNHEFSEIWVNLKQKLRDGKKIFSISSALRTEGKTTLSMHLAINFAQKGAKVLLVDADIFLPRMTKVASDNGIIGFQNYLTGEHSLDEIVAPTVFENLWMVGAGSNTSGKIISFDHPLINSFIAEVKPKYDLIIVDTPALLYIPDIVNLMEQMDGVVLIARMMHTTRRSFEKTLEKMEAGNCNVLGTIITDVKVSPLTKYSNYHYKGYYGYGYGYEERPQSKSLFNIFNVIRNRE